MVRASLPKDAANVAGSAAYVCILQQRRGRGQVTAAIRTCLARVPPKTIAGVAATATTFLRVTRGGTSSKRLDAPSRAVRANRCMIIRRIRANAGDTPSPERPDPSFLLCESSGAALGGLRYAIEH